MGCDIWRCSHGRHTSSVIRMRGLSFNSCNTTDKAFGPPILVTTLCLLILTVVFLGLELGVYVSVHESRWRSQCLCKPRQELCNCCRSCHCTSAAIDFGVYQAFRRGSPGHAESTTLVYCWVTTVIKQYKLPFFKPCSVRPSCWLGLTHRAWFKKNDASLLFVLSVVMERRDPLARVQGEAGHSDT